MVLKESAVALPTRVDEPAENDVADEVEERLSGVVVTAAAVV